MRFLILAMMALLIPLGACKEERQAGNDKITLEYLQERYGQHGIPFDANLIDLYNQTNNKCPKDVHIAYFKDKELPLDEMVKSYRAWRPAYLGLKKIYVNVQEPVFRDKSGNFAPFTKERWLAMGRDEAEYRVITPEFLKESIEQAVMSQMAYCTVKNGQEPQKDVIQFVDTATHENIKEENSLTITVRGEEFATQKNSWLQARKYRPEWNIFLCTQYEGDICNIQNAVPYEYLAFEKDATFPYLVNSIEETNNSSSVKSIAQKKVNLIKGYSEEIFQYLVK